MQVYESLMRQKQWSTGVCSYQIMNVLFPLLIFHSLSDILWCFLIEIYGPLSVLKSFLEKSTWRELETPAQIRLTWRQHQRAFGNTVSANAKTTKDLQISQETDESYLYMFFLIRWGAPDSQPITLSSNRVSSLHSISQSLAHTIKISFTPLSRRKECICLNFK